MAQILKIVFAGVMLILSVFALSMRIRGTDHVKGKYTPFTQKMIIAIVATPLYLLLTVQLVRVFERFNPTAVLY
ncbi:MAG: hypothetical protein HY934_05715 [Candidatus Firestonebacteria bacterium]|nr:hypothetical protein [Candidatus Firestonebacteria bacterium]